MTGGRAGVAVMGDFGAGDPTAEGFTSSSGAAFFFPLTAFVSRGFLGTAAFFFDFFVSTTALSMACPLSFGASIVVEDFLPFPVPREVFFAADILVLLVFDVVGCDSLSDVSSFPPVKRFSKQNQRLFKKEKEMRTYESGENSR